MSSFNQLQGTAERRPGSIQVVFYNTIVNRYPSYHQFARSKSLAFFLGRR